ncbi:MAG TPA: polysaccharide biosynthesis/export family protein [Pyrinomonadaceae bacterium]|jgi:protein involved in polysaccharide export with SLBB domain|nr:polysaccharide biosynthesis/export family protein [Pyrinomonadaceae bacterium]
MKTRIARLATLALAASVSLAATPLRTLAQQQPDKNEKGKQKQSQQQRQPAPPRKPGERLEPDDTSAPPRTDLPPGLEAARHEGLAEEEANVTPYYNNFMATYRLGPEDVISIRVFGNPLLERYSKTGIIIPPNAVITHALIPEGIFVAGKTTEQVRDEIIKKLDEYIVGPKVDVTLEKAQSAVFWVAGDVGQPGIRPMTRRVSVTEALYLAGGVLETGNKSKVMVNRRGPDGFITTKVINVSAIEKGKQPDNYYLAPGDQVLVPGNRLKTVRKVLDMLPVINFFRVFTGVLGF